MNEFADAEMFLIDGDSLLMELALDKNLDWIYSGQLLHLVYLFERYLDLFVRKDGVFQIVFFKDFDEVCKSQPCIYLARKVIIQHLMANVSYKLLSKFQNPWDPEFLKYIKDFVPSFMLLSDGEILSEPQDQRLISATNVARIFVHHLLKVLSLEMNCAFTYGIEFGTSTLNGFHVMYSPMFRGWKIPMPVKTLIHSFSDSFDVSSLPEVVDSVLIKLKRNSSMFDVSCQDKDGVIDCRLVLHVVTVSVYLKLFLTAENQDFQHDLVRVLLLHGVFLTQLPLKYRAYSLDDSKNLLTNSTIHHQVKESLGKLQFIMARVLDVFIQALTEEDSLWSMSGICDAWDGRLFYQVLFLLLESKSDGRELPLSESSKRKFESLVRVVSSLLDDEEELEASHILQCLGNNENYLGNTTQSEKQIVVKEEDGLIQMDCSLLNEYAGKILENTSVKKLDINDPNVSALVVSGNDFDETYHWHSGKPLSDEYDRTKESNSDIQDKRVLQKIQDKYARYMQRYGQSLQDEVKYKPIVVEKASKNHKKEKNKVSKKRLAIREENNMKMEEKKLKKEEDSWVMEKKWVKQYEDEGRYDVAIDIVNRFLGKVTEGKIRIGILLTRARILWKKWKEYCKMKKDDRDESDAEMLFLTIQELVENSKEALPKKDKDTLAEYLVDLGFKDIVLKTNLTEKSFEYNDEYSLKISSSRFQLHNLGDKLERETRIDRDSRVEHFIPETWQRELLDAVDNKQSALIVAPTSSGKTFASYYCMERVLKEDNDGVVVYVSPTKALVNQVAATCCVRYDNCFGNAIGKFRKKLALDLNQSLPKSLSGAKYM